MAAPDAPGGLVTVHGVTVAEFQGDRICSLRQYWDEFAVAERIHRGQLDGIVSAGSLCQQVAPSMRVMKIPGLFQSRDEASYVTNLHKPSGNYADENTIRAVGEITKSHGARVLVDEVYLESFYENRPKPALHYGEHFLVTSSLTTGRAKRYHR